MKKAVVVKAQFESEMLNLTRDLDKLKKEKALWESSKKFEGRDQEQKYVGGDEKVRKFQSRVLQCFLALNQVKCLHNYTGPYSSTYSAAGASDTHELET